MSSQGRVTAKLLAAVRACLDTTTAAEIEENVRHDVDKFIGYMKAADTPNGSAEGFEKLFAAAFAALAYQTRSGFMFVYQVLQLIHLKEANDNTNDLSSLSASNLAELCHSIVDAVRATTDDGNGSTFGDVFQGFKTTVQQFGLNLCERIVPKILELANNAIKEDHDVSQAQEALRAIGDVIPVGEEMKSQVTAFMNSCEKSLKPKVGSLTAVELQCWVSVMGKVEQLKSVVPSWPLLPQLGKVSLESAKASLEAIATVELGKAYAGLRDGWTSAKKQSTEVFEKIFGQEEQEKVEDALKTARILLACQSGLGFDLGFDLVTVKVCPPSFESKWCIPGRIHFTIPDSTA